MRLREYMQAEPQDKFTIAFDGALHHRTEQANIINEAHERTAGLEPMAARIGALGYMGMFDVVTYMYVADSIRMKTHQICEKLYTLLAQRSEWVYGQAEIPGIRSEQYMGEEWHAAVEQLNRRGK